jgi:hypothetical protein
MRFRSLVPPLMVLVLFAAACGGGAPAASPTMDMNHSPAAERPASSGTVKIVRPTNGEVVKGPNVDVKVALDGATVVAQTSTDLKPDEGHLHLILDDELVSMTSGLTTTIPDVAPGRHLLKVEFVASDHGPFFPNVVAVTSFEVKG